MKSVWRIDYWTWLSLFALGLALWLTISYASLILEVGAILFGAFLLSVGLRPIVERLARWHIPRPVTALLVYAGFAGVLVSIGILLVPVVRDEVATLGHNVPDLVQQVGIQLEQTPFAGWIPSMDTEAQALAQRLEPLIFDAATMAVGIGTIFLDVLVLLILAYSMTTEQIASGQWLIRWAPREWHTHAEHVWPPMINRLSRWVWAQGGIALFFALSSAGGLLLLHVPYALTIGLTGGILAVVPYLGPIVATLLAVLSALTISFPLAGVVLLLYILLATLESHFVAPLLYGRAIGLRSSAVLVALLIGLKVAGILGLFFAVPVAVVLVALTQALRARD